MPYVRQPATAESQGDLIDALAAELQAPAPQGQPLILEDATPATGLELTFTTKCGSWDRI